MGLALKSRLSTGIREFAVEQQAARQEALQRVRSAEGEIRDLVLRFSACTESLLKTLDAAPLRAILRYELTHRALLAELDRVKRTREFLAHAKPSERLVVGAKVLDKAAVARDVLGQRPDIDNDALSVRRPSTF